MEKEVFFTGYCRCLDQSRMVAAVSEDGELTEVDCSYGNCPYESGCPIALKIREFLNEA